jgi:hypothetical protein
MQPSVKSEESMSEWKTQQQVIWERHTEFIWNFYQRNEEMTQEQNFCARCGKRLGGIDSIHTCTLPQRTWVGLTDDEIAQGCKESWVTEQAWQSAVWWAEEKLKEKNT